jgi:hypothetical protein
MKTEVKRKQQWDHQKKMNSILKKKKDEQQTLMIDIAGYHVNRMSLNKF